MKQILADITPMGSNNLFVTHYWPDKQTDPPLHYHEDYMLCLTLHVRGQRIMDDAVEDFTEKDLLLICQTDWYFHDKFTAPARFAFHFNAAAA